MSKNILIGVTGSIAGYKACELISIFKKKGYSVRCAMSRDAKWFITPLMLEVLTGKKVVEDMFKLPEERDPVHISLADEADVILIAPATADIIGRVASGIMDDALSCAVFAADCPVIFAPAMNDKMYLNRIVRDNISRLKKAGYKFVDPVEGQLACGRKGIGHLAPLEEIVDQVETALTKLS